VEPSKGKAEESAVAILRFSMWYPPPVSVKDRGVGTREQVLNVPIACQWYGPGKPISLLLTDVWLKRTASMAVLGEKLRQVPRTIQPGWEVESGAFFLGSSESVQLCWVSVKGCHVWGSPTGSIHWAYVDWCGKRTWHVDQVFPYRVYIDSNRRDSRIWVTACSWLSSSSNLQDYWLMFNIKSWLCFTLITCLQPLLD
jgi:hypothetical protein